MVPGFYTDIGVYFNKTAKLSGDPREGKSRAWGGVTQSTGQSCVNKSLGLGTVYGDHPPKYYLKEESDKSILRIGNPPLFGLIHFFCCSLIFYFITFIIN